MIAVLYSLLRNWHDYCLSNCRISHLLFFLLVEGLQYTNVNGDKYNWCLCGRSYKYYRSLYAHQKYECGKTPQFKCCFCPSIYKHRHKLKEHFILKHNLNFEEAAKMTKL